jgi:hypothetical protein
LNAENAAQGPHVILLGDSIFDKDAYLSAFRVVAHQLRGTP